MLRATIAVVTVVALSVLLVGCTAPPEGEVPLSEFAVPDSLAHSSYFHQRIHWGSCGEDADHVECATAQAPLDWTGRHPGSVQLALVRHRATGTRLGALLINPGGPGESGVDLVGSDLADAVTSDVAEHYDVIGFDPRGVGSSTAVDCSGSAALDRLLYAPMPGAVGSEKWVAANVARSRHFARGCRTASGELLDHIDTVSAAEDLDVLRSAIGEKKLNYLGYSYGSYLGTVYAGLHPTHVGRFVFDGADDPWFEDGEIGKDGKESGSLGGGSGLGDVPDGVVDQAHGFDGALKDFVTACLAGDSTATGGQPCPFQGSVDAADATIESELAAATAHPMTAADGRELDGAGLALAITSALYSSDQWPDLARMFAQVSTRDPEQAFLLADSYNGRNSDGSYSGNSFEANLAIQCLESGPGYDLEADRAQLKQLTRYAPVLGPFFAFSDLQCEGWSGPAAWPQPVTAAGAGPILVVSTTQDPATPYDDGVALAHQLTSGHLVTFVGEGHTAYDTGNHCVDGVIDDFLLKGTVPAHDPKCT